MPYQPAQEGCGMRVPFHSGVGVSIKDQVEFAKEELTQDEKLLSGLIKAERFYKKNKTAIMSLLVILVVGAVGYAAMEYVNDRKLEAANAALLKLDKNPDDSSAMKTLEENDPELAALFMLKRASEKGEIKTLESLSKSEDPVISDLASYHLGVWQKDLQKIKSYRMKSGALLRDFALFDEAYLLMKEGRKKEAKERLDLIGEKSPLKPVANMLAHYGIVEEKGGE